MRTSLSPYRASRLSPYRASRRALAAGAVAALGAAAGLSLAGAGEAQAAVTGPAVRMVPANVTPGADQRIVTASGTAAGNKMTLQVDLGLRTQKWHLRFNGGSVAQIVSDANTSLCLRGSGVTGNVIRLATCVDPNRLDLSETERAQFWQDRQRSVNGKIAHRFESVVGGPGRPMGIRSNSTQVGALLEQQTLTGDLGQLFTLQTG